MLKLKRSNLHDPQWEKKGVRCPTYPAKALVQQTAENPTWLHIGPGNIFRGYIAEIMDDLIARDPTAGGIVALSTSDAEKLRILRDRWDMLTLQAVRPAEGPPRYRVLGAVTEGLAAADPVDWARALEVAVHPGLSLISLTITEKGYRLTDVDGRLTPAAEHDRTHGPDRPRHGMGVVAALLLARYRAGAAPIALVSFDNFTHNGDRIRSAVTELADAWIAAGYAPEGFGTYLTDPDTVAYPVTVIDRIVPRADPATADDLAGLGITDLGPVVTAKGQDIAAYVNTEAAHYLLIEDRFPNGRPPFEAAGVYMTDRTTVDRFEGMKVATCLNPLHTALAVAGCLLGHPTIAACMDDPDLDHFVRMIGGVEGLPVTQDPGIIDPEAFLAEVTDHRLPNPHTGDTPQRIATDTSQKVAIRFGTTLSRYVADPDLDPGTLRAIPLALALWFRYLLAVDDTGAPFTPSPDPQLDALTGHLAPLTLGTEEQPGPDRATVAEVLTPLLRRDTLFGLDLVDAGLAERIIDTVTALTQGPGAVRTVLAALRADHPLPTD